MAGVRPLIQTPPLPRITTQEPAVERDGAETGRSIHRGPVEQAERRLPAWKGPASAPAFDAKQPARSASVFTAKHPGCFASAASPAASRAARPSEAVARIVEPSTILRLRQGNVLRLAVGDLVIDLVLRDSRLYGKVLAETATAKDLIESQLNDLRQGLERRGVEVAAFEVVFAESEPSPSGPSSVRSVRRLVLDVLA